MALFGRSASHNPWPACCGSSFPRIHAPRIPIKLTVFVRILVFVGLLARRGILPRTRRIVPGELAISD